MGGKLPVFGMGWQKKMFDFLDDRDGEGTPQNMSLLRDEKDPLQY